MLLFQATDPNVTFSLSNIIAIVLAFLGFVGTVSMLVMNLRVTNAMKDVKLDIAQFRLISLEKQSGLELQIASMRLEISKEQSSLYKSITDNIQGFYAGRQEVQNMHASNVARLESIETRLRNVEERMPV